MTREERKVNKIKRGLEKVCRNNAQSYLLRYLYLMGGLQGFQGGSHISERPSSSINYASVAKIAAIKNIHPSKEIKRMMSTSEFNFLRSFF